MKLHPVRIWLFAFFFGCAPLFLASPAAGSSSVVAGFSLRSIAAVGSGHAPKAKACGYGSNESDQDRNPDPLPTPVMFGAWYDVILGSRRNVMTAAAVVILMGIFVLRKTNYRQ